MPIVTLAEVKGFLQIDDDDFNTAISNLIPVVTERLRILANNDFTAQSMRDVGYRNFEPRTRFARQTFSYATSRRMSGRGYFYGPAADPLLYILPAVSATFAATAKTVTARASDFASAQFAGAQDIIIAGSYLNDGYYEVDSVSTSTLTILSAYSFAGAVAGTHEFIAEVTGATITFAVVNWPNDIKPIVSSLIQYDYQERGTWSDTPSAEGYGEYGYPLELLRSLLPYTTPTFGMYRR
jgi:hypothetical protein